MAIIKAAVIGSAMAKRLALDGIPIDGYFTERGPNGEDVAGIAYKGSTRCLAVDVSRVIVWSQVFQHYVMMKDSILRDLAEGCTCEECHCDKH